MLTLKLFNAVVAQQPANAPYVSSHGYVIVPSAMWAKDRIFEYYTKERLSGNDLNKTFHKSWKKIQDSSRFELFVDQIDFIQYSTTKKFGKIELLKKVDFLQYLPEK